MNIKPGETKTLTCGGCSTEFEITLEPKAKRDKKSAATMPDQTLVVCPFCGKDELQCDDEEDDG